MNDKTLAPQSPIPAQLLFVDYESASGERTSPEIVVRAAGEVWACGQSSDDPLSIDSADVSVDDAKCRVIARICAVRSAVSTAPASAARRPATAPSAQTPCRCSARSLAHWAHTSQRATTAGACCTHRQASGRYSLCMRVLLVANALRGEDGEGLPVAAWSVRFGEYGPAELPENHRYLRGQCPEKVRMVSMRISTGVSSTHGSRSSFIPICVPMRGGTTSNPIMMAMP